MKTGLTGKLVLVLLLISTLLIGTVVIASRWSFQSGFIDYLTRIEARKLQPLAEALTRAYEREGDWRFLQDNPRLWHHYLAYLSDNPPDTDILPAPSADTMPSPGFRPPPPPHFNPGVQGGPPPGEFGSPYAPPPPGGFELQRQLPPPPPTDQSGIGTRTRLLDSDKRLLAGPPDPSTDAMLQPLQLAGQTIGWLSLTPMPLPQDELARHFNQQQLRGLSLIAIVALILVMVLAIPLGRHLTRPVRRMAGGMQELTRGQFDTRIAVTRQDELGQLARDFNTLAESLQRNEALRRQGMADASHELRTPLAVLRAEIEAMQDGVRSCSPERLATLHSHVQGLSRLVDDLYDLSLSDSGSLSYQKDDIDLADIIEQAVSAAHPRFEQAGIHLSQQIDSPLPALADHRRLRQVLDNLLSNSRRYTDAGGETELKAFRHGDRLHIEISDSAPGVEPSTLPRLFERFYRVEASHSRATGGSGLGLAICRNIIEAHQGNIKAVHSPLGGISVHIQLPANN